MSMVCGLDLHRGQITFDILEEESGESGAVGSGSQIVNGSGGGSRARWLLVPRAARWRSRWRAARAGGMWSRRSLRLGSNHTSRNRQTPRPCVDASIEPRPTAPTPGCSRDLLAGRRAARVVDPARSGARVARADAALQEPGGSAGGVGAADPRRAVPARRGAARGAHPFGEHPGRLLGHRRAAESGRAASASRSATG